MGRGSEKQERLAEKFYSSLRWHGVALALLDHAWMPRPREVFETGDPSSLPSGAAPVAVGSLSKRATVVSSARVQQNWDSRPT